ncbi:hypothetical protein BDF20DRAFT_900230, partial [Mycotypha africana]|uniref:uncharacterized protein n=1 Tax=Mycotypha africana TaxID=64632 RepID=UPI002301215E
MFSCPFSGCRVCRAVSLFPLWIFLIRSLHCCKKNREFRHRRFFTVPGQQKWLSHERFIANKKNFSSPPGPGNSNNYYWCL